MSHNQIERQQNTKEGQKVTSKIVGDFGVQSLQNLKQTFK